MTTQKLPIISAFVFITLAISGCASQSQMNSLQADVDALRQMTEKAAQDANQALQDTALLKNDIAAVRQSSESASADAASTRQLLEQMNERLERSGGSNSFK